MPSSEPVEPAARTDRYTELYQHWDTTGRAECGDSWRSPGELGGRHRVCEALNHPELLQRTDEQIRHGLDMLGAECRERARQGQEDPWRWFRHAWNPRVLSRACDVPDEAAATARASPAATARASPGRPSAMNAFTADDFRRERERGAEF